MNTDFVDALSPFLITLGCLLLVIAAAHDIAARTVSNRLVVGLALAGCALRALDGTLLLSGAAAAFVFAGAYVCWLFRALGGGDVKLLTAATLFVAPHMAPTLLTGMCLSGGMIALPFLVARRRISRSPPGRPTAFLGRVLRAERWRLRRGGPLPYAVAIACGALFVVIKEGLPQ